MNKKWLLIVGVILVLIGSYFLMSHVKDGETIISMDEYKKYDVYGLDMDESEAFTWLLENLEQDDFIDLEIEDLDSTWLESISEKNNKMIQEKLAKCNKIQQLLLILDEEGKAINFMIDYRDDDHRRVILTYTYTGYVDKTIGYPNKVVSVTNELVMQTMKK